MATSRYLDQRSLSPLLMRHQGGLALLLRHAGEVPFYRQMSSLVDGAETRYYRGIVSSSRPLRTVLSRVVNSLSRVRIALRA